MYCRLFDWRIAEPGAFHDHPEIKSRLWVRAGNLAAILLFSPPVFSFRLLLCTLLLLRIFQFFRDGAVAVGFHSDGDANVVVVA